MQGFGLPGHSWLFPGLFPVPSAALAVTRAITDPVFVQTPAVSPWWFWSKGLPQELLDQSWDCSAPRLGPVQGQLLSPPRVTAPSCLAG